MSLESSNQKPKKVSDSEEQLGVCVIILDKNHKNILLGKRLNSYRAGTYGLPGGRLNKKETLIEGARRELVEETSLIANKLQYVGVIREYQEDNNFNFIHFVYSCDDFSGIPKTVEPDKCEGWRWYPLDTLPENLIKGHRWALDMYRKKSSTLCDIID
jgi:ADP-ribose pyrophosphatase YjhB (NUDIX family)